MNIVLATQNQSKIDQITAVFKGLDLRVLSLVDAGVTGEAIEDGATLEENAFKKASHAYAQVGGWVMSEDTGLFIDALGGQPGIHAARWAGEGLTTEEIMHFTLEKLKDIELCNRTARFITVAIVISPDGEKSCFSGSIHGLLLHEPRTKCQPKMPYSALFMPNGENKVWAEMTTEEENEISHRGQAFALVRSYFEEVLSKAAG